MTEQNKESVETPDTEQNLTEEVAQAAALPPKNRLKKWLKRIAFYLSLLFIFLIGFTVWLVQTPSGLRFAAFSVPSLFGVDISAKKTEGTIWKGFSAEGLEIDTKAANIELSSLAFHWQSSKIWSKQLWVDLIDVGVVKVQTKKTEEKDTPPPKLPDNIGLPLNVHVGKIKLEGLVLNNQTEQIVWGSALSYDYQNEQHKLTIEAVNTPWISFKGESTLNNLAPFALAGNIQMETKLDSVSAQGKVNLDGNLQELDLSGGLSSDSFAITFEGKPRPFEAQMFKKLNHIRATVGGLNLHQFDERAPDAPLSMGLLLDGTKGDYLHGSLDFANLSPMAANEKGIPIRLLQTQVKLDDQGVIKLDDFVAYGLEEGLLNLSGQVALTKKEIDLRLSVVNMQLHDVIASDFPDKLNGEVKAKGLWENPDLSWNLTTDRLNSKGKLNFVKQAKGQQLLIPEAFIQAKAGGKINLNAALDLFEKRALKVKASTQNLNPETLLPSLPKGSITSNLNVEGFLEEPLKLDAKLKIEQSRVAQANLRGFADISLVQDHLTKANIDISLGSNSIKTQGSFGAEKDKLNININAPRLNEAGLDFLTGSVVAKGSVAGTPKKLIIDLMAKADALQYRNTVRIVQLDAKVKASPDITTPMAVQITGKDVFLLGKTPQENTQISNISFNLNGTGAKHHFEGATETTLAGNHYKIQLAANGGLNKNYDWKGTIQKLDVKDALDVLLQTPVSLDVGAEHLILGKANWAALGGSLQLDKLIWHKASGFSTKGRGSNLRVDKLTNIVHVPYTENLVLKGDWDISYGSSMRGYAKIEHQSGDIAMPVSKSGKKSLPLGISKLLLNANLNGNTIRFDVDGVTRHATVKGSVALNQNANNFALSTLSGKVDMSVPDLTSFRLLVPVGMNVGGSLQAHVTLSGTVGKPNLGGTLSGENLLYRERNLGLRLAEGTLRSHFIGQGIVIDSLSFKSYNGTNRPNGTLTTKGPIYVKDGFPAIDLDVIFDKFNVFEARPNRILVISGNGKLTAFPSASANHKNEAALMQMMNVNVNGNLKIDFGRIDLPKVGTPALDSDVIIVTQKIEEKAPLPAITANIALDFGEQFTFQGLGLTVQLGGKMNMHSKPNDVLRASGQIHITKGGYRAYGQDLVIEKGIISFNQGNTITDPVLSVRAKRRYSPVGAGVEVKGPVSAMMITLIADEPMSPKDKLAWLILGRDPSSAEDEDALAASAGAWLAGSVNDKVRFFDDLGIITRPKKVLKTGEVSPAEQMAMVGRHLSDTLYVGYEYGLDSAESAVRLSYQITRTLQLIFRAGTKASSAEAKYSIRFD